MSDVLANPRTSALFGVFIGLAIALVILIAMFVRIFIKKRAVRQREQEELNHEIRMLQRQRDLLAATISLHQAHLSPAELEQLPRHLHVHADNEPGTVADGYETSNTCGICLNDYFNNDLVVNLPCKHAFHDQCITQWLSTSDKCPFCSAPARFVGDNGDIV
ncbi:E3 ubiquitin-protein ligase rnf38 [Coemansia sp. RSA 2337]|nr:E3 ubiquitin-protein ligase rnf38 [Coemansia sp. S680]KAJ2062757.1 E3 ubiquitin-protein ligase rnf38 [Coemansia sp. S2]KAJ2087646.1 E3 ubiquitin-protein ligase rnf38 [Coemansia sp. S100]KAJ2100524.1 E3 ubiquitin-protein ligase rnf38 [Coemansia sp. RSA 922]KAJ2456916.1 E3 ubiquitin-protein ligase rnf38 [Coemansia sp. RSA 2337]